MKIVKLLIFGLFLVPCYVGSAAAYLDPGTGSILLQGLLAVIAGTAVTLKVYWAKLRGYFTRAETEPDPADHD